MNSLSAAPLFKISLAVLTGVLMTTISWTSIACCLGLLTLFFLLLVILNQNPLVSKIEISHLIGILLIWGAMGFLRGSWQASQPTESDRILESINCQEVVLRGILMRPVKHSDWGSKAQMEIEAYFEGKHWKPVKGKLIAYLGSELEPGVGDTLCMKGKLSTLFSQYPAYLQHLKTLGFQHSLHVEQAVVVGKGYSLTAISYRLQQQAVQRLDSVISEPRVKGLAHAMFLGEKRELSYEQKKAFAASGASHVLAISGLHVGIIFLLLNVLLKGLLHFAYGRQIRALLILGILLAYMFLTGASPAVCRATLMLGIILVFQFYRARYSRLNVLGLAALIQIWIDPTVVTQIGFQLSYTAVLGIILLMPWFESSFKADNSFLSKIYGWIGISLVATCATTPLVLFYFGQFPSYFLLTNVIISCFVSLLVMLGFLTVLLAGVPVVGELLGRLSTRLLELLDFTCLEISRLPNAVLDIHNWEIQSMGVLLFQLILASVFLCLPKIKRLFILKYFYHEHTKQPQFAGVHQPVVTSHLGS